MSTTKILSLQGIYYTHKFFVLRFAFFTALTLELLVVSSCGFSVNPAGQLERGYVKTWHITSTPSGAEVYLNGNLVGVTPADIQAVIVSNFGGYATIHHVIVRKPGYQPAGGALDQSSSTYSLRGGLQPGRNTYHFTLQRQ